MQTMVPLYGFGGVPYSAVRKAAPRNLLDNSDFRNPVDQRGGKLIPPGVPYYVYAQGQAGTTSTYCTVTKTSGNLAFIIIDGNEYVADTSTMVDGYSGPVYTIDRWRITNKYSSVTVDDDGVTFSANGSMCYPQQLIVANTNMVGKTFTAAICLKDGSVTVTSGVLTALSPASNTLIGNRVAITNGNGAELAMYARTDGNLMIQPHIPDGVSLGLRWAALYEGEYTAETLPEYQPKGYGAELAECQRYYINLNPNNFIYDTVAFGIGWAVQNEVDFIVNLPVTMRKTPSFTNQNNLRIYDVIADSFVELPSSIAILLNQNGLKIVCSGVNGWVNGRMYTLNTLADNVSIGLTADL